MREASVRVPRYGKKPSPSYTSLNSAPNGKPSVRPYFRLCSWQLLPWNRNFSLGCFQALSRWLWQKLKKKWKKHFPWKVHGLTENRKSMEKMFSTEITTLGFSFSIGSWPYSVLPLFAERVRKSLNATVGKQLCKNSGFFSCESRCGGSKA